LYVVKTGHEKIVLILQKLPIKFLKINKPWSDFWNHSSIQELDYKRLLIKCNENL